MKASAGMPRRRERVQYQQVSAFEWGRMVGLREAGLSYRDTATRKEHAGTSMEHVWNQWREEGRMQRRADTAPRNATTAWDDRHIVHMAVMDRTASSAVLSRRWSTATGLDLYASTVRLCLLSAGQVACMPLCWLPLSRDYQCLRLQWVCKCHHWHTEWQVMFSDESRFNMFYNDGRIRVRCYAGELNLRACILQQNRGPMPV